MDRPELYSEDRPWGAFMHLTDIGSNPTVKQIEVFKDKRNSLQRHKWRHEHWFIIKGCFRITIGSEEHIGNPGDHFWVPQGTAHRFAGLADENMLIEVSYGKFDENDNERLEDDWGRPSLA